MIDMVGLCVFFKPEYVHNVGTHECLKDMQGICSELNMELEATVFFSDGKPVLSKLRHSYESLPSNLATLAYKLIDGTDLKKTPYIRISGNPAKLLQGHNVYGSSDPELCVMAVIEAFHLSFPELSDKLDWYHSLIEYIDVTYSARVANEHQAQQVIDTLKNLSYGQTKVSTSDKYKTTVYWGKGSEHKELKAYIKLPEVMRQIKSLSHKYVKCVLKKTTPPDHIVPAIEAMSNKKLLDFATGLVRFEARLKSRWLKANGINLVLSHFINPETPINPEHLWQIAFKDILTTFEGATMNAHDTTQVLNQLRQTHFTYTRTGNISYAKAERLYDFYVSITKDGYKATKERIATRSRATFKRNQDALLQAGLSLAQLMQFTGDQSNVIPLIRLINVDFANQRPTYYTEPQPLRQRNLTPVLRLAS
ncbi:MAG: phage/plasmid replication protein, II/X family [Opitutales bacterium]|nr:phage/plasmid replication protein, II/X family [Opitutales bacterium]